MEYNTDLKRKIIITVLLTVDLGETLTLKICVQNT